MRNSLFYSRVRKSVSDLACHVVEFFDKHSEYDWPETARELAGEHWDEFCQFWTKHTGDLEDPTWFALIERRHNAHWFLMWVFTKHPETAKRFREAMESTHA